VVASADVRSSAFPRLVWPASYQSGEYRRLESIVLEVDPQANTAVPKFTMDGYFAGLLPLVP
jgi:hypothetical protein